MREAVLPKVATVVAAAIGAGVPVVNVVAVTRNCSSFFSI